MKKFVKFASLLLIAAMLLSVLACGDTGNKPTEAPTSEPTEAPTEKPTPEPTEEPTPEPTPDPAAELLGKWEFELEWFAEASEAFAEGLGCAPIYTAEPDDSELLCYLEFFDDNTCKLSYDLDSMSTVYFALFDIYMEPFCEYMYSLLLSDPSYGFSDRDSVDAALADMDMTMSEYVDYIISNMPLEDIVIMGGFDPDDLEIGMKYKMEGNKLWIEEGSIASNSINYAVISLSGDTITVTELHGSTPFGSFTESDDICPIILTRVQQSQPV